MKFHGNFRLSSLKQTPIPHYEQQFENCQDLRLMKQEFIARKTTTETCSDPCAKRFYKVKQRQKAIQRVEVEAMVKRKPHAYFSEEEVRVVQAKEWLPLKVALLLNVSPLTLRRWTLAGKIQSKKVGEEACV